MDKPNTIVVTDKTERERKDNIFNSVSCFILMDEEGFFGITLFNINEIPESFDPSKGRG